MAGPLRIDRLWTVRGVLSLPPAATGVIALIAERLEDLVLDHREQTEDRLSWRQGFVGFVFHRDWNLLGGVDSGVITVADGRLTYQLRFGHVLILCLVASIFAGLFAGTGAGATLVDGISWGMTAMFWLFGANYAVTLFQVRRFFQQTIAASGVA